jgi:predicted nucleotidyltransferase
VPAMAYDISLWKKMQDDAHADREKKRGEALASAVDSLKRYFTSKRVAKVFLIGSILREDAFYDFSDIDIVVEDLDEDYFSTLSELETILDRDVDLIEFEEEHRLKDEIVKRGMRIK